ncbi:MAG: hypothetical protein ACRCTD_17485, partial [Beijerinckiaceae bacterium]
MKRITFTVTHKGWVGLCPVYFSEIESMAPIVMERHRFFAPLHDLSIFIFESIAWVASRFGASGFDTYPLLITGEV